MAKKRQNIYLEETLLETAEKNAVHREVESLSAYIRWLIRRDDKAIKEEQEQAAKK